MELLTIEEVLPIFKVNRQTFSTWMRRNKLPEQLFFRVGTTIRIRKAILEKYISGEI